MTSPSHEPVGHVHQRIVQVDEIKVNIFELITMNSSEPLGSGGVGFQFI